MRKKTTAGKERTRRQLEQTIAAYQKLAEEDWLTGLYNGRAMEEKAGEYLKRNRAGSMILMDIDQFKKINDTYGHIIGDQLLQDIASVLKKMFPSGCLIGRCGGDEFAIFMPQTLEEEDIQRRCRQIRERFVRVEVNGTVILRLSMTICGGSYHPGFGYKDLFDLADQKIVKEKRSRTGETLERAAVADVNGDEIRIDMKILVKISDQERELLRSQLINLIEKADRIKRSLEE